MDYQALYRMFRPQSFEDVVGQEHVTKTLKNAIAKGKQSHAYIFSGPRGTGKTSIAKIFAKAINCEVRDDGEPCNECASCKGITQGYNSDVIEIDAASNNGVDEIRNIRDKVKYAPSESKYKVYIIDEVHMLTTGAFNALLKTLEEPPAHAIFILATTEPHKIPPTIISRAQRFDFKAINANRIVDRLRYVAHQQQIEFDEAALTFIAKVSEGGMRDALSIMDQAIAFGDERLTLKDALDVTGSLDESDLNALFQDVVQGHVHEAFERYHQFVSEGKEVNRLINDMIYFVRDTIMAKTTQLETEYDALMPFNLEVLYKMIDVINDTLVSIRFSVNQNVHLEVLLVKLSEMVKEVNRTGEVVVNHAPTEQHDAMMRRMEALESELQTLKSQGFSTATAPPKPPAAKRRGSGSTYSIEQIAKVLDKANKEDIALIKERWADVIQYAKDRNQKSLVSLLQNSEPVAASEDKVLIKFDEEIHCEILKKDEEKKRSIENVVKDMINKSVEVVGVPADKWMQVRSDYISNRKRGNTQSNASEAKKPAEQQNDVVQTAKDLFGEEMVHLMDEET
ncbi:DNA polymerase III subunit gamma/tau [Staphylococcus pseudintermedius]|uniref:DNA polymerase III subunit gamma/tau n=1 Tax=Staphylococcus pseudintermedius TaxID=283734 RepID=UPI000D738493|nr:DNA polymerase III subunit gamma/tau [Staphylococcus pseudintermedius]EGQ0298603.1 DNA polymerase III subunit gamma/tau [Staphylococcus pseudintermedius]EGQ0395763.1 DNA polymerase III subunit gamma/tau [Staphylococcus pseudintermedius]EGQ0399190.1 DNA polymerase III subunit gamma/tau [Staphylococcus pseudintermedius]EGQ1283325.1 DNA polymerase III subunit gamma/tau [Staphylococcus pseudintermedius]EGQ1606928.1 DNA polymerase III subunit gamma/tau [Staphylococcus pseudintermedius]